MRIARITLENDAYYHCMSRIIERRFLLGETEKEKFRLLMRNLEIFCGIEILTYAILDSHWHILLKVPAPRHVSDMELIRRLNAIYEPNLVSQIATQLKEFRESGNHEDAENLKAQYTYRMYNVSEFFKTLKQCFSQWYNRRNNRRGPLWEERFKSILVEGSNNALFTMAAYIDLNPVRAGIVADPANYRYCGYGEAVGGARAACTGIRRIIQYYSPEASWARVQCMYRKQLYIQGAATESRPGFSCEDTEKVLKEGGKLSMGILLRCRIRYFSDGIALGSKIFIEDVFDRYRLQFSEKRASGARPMKHGNWNGLCTMRNLRLNPVSMP